MQKLFRQKHVKLIEETTTKRDTNRTVKKRYIIDSRELEARKYNLTCYQITIEQEPLPFVKSLLGGNHNQVSDHYKEGITTMYQITTGSSHHGRSLCQVLNSRLPRVLCLWIQTSLPTPTVHAASQRGPWPGYVEVTNH